MRLSYRWTDTGRQQMRHLLSTRTVIAFSALIALVSAGLPVAPAAAAIFGPRMRWLPDAPPGRRGGRATGCPTGVGLTITPVSTASRGLSRWFCRRAGRQLLRVGLVHAGAAQRQHRRVPGAVELDETRSEPSPRPPLVVYRPRQRPHAEEAWSTTPLTPENTGVNMHYPVPDGFGASFVRAGGD